MFTEPDLTVDGGHLKAQARMEAMGMPEPVMERNLMGDVQAGPLERTSPSYLRRPISALRGLSSSVNSAGIMYLVDGLFPMVLSVSRYCSVIVLPSITWPRRYLAQRLCVTLRPQDDGLLSPSAFRMADFLSPSATRMVDSLLPSASRTMALLVLSALIC